MQFIFLPKHYYDTLKDRKLSLSDLEKIYLNQETCMQLSDFTKCLFLEINRYLNLILFNKKLNNYIFNLNEIEKNNIKNKLKEFTSNQALYNVEKYYEFQRVSENTTFVVFSDSFIYHLTETKENYLEFLLNVLCYLDSMSLEDEEILRRYLLFKNKDTTLEYLKLQLL